MSEDSIISSKNEDRRFFDQKEKAVVMERKD